MIKVNNLSKSYKNKLVLDKVDLTISKNSLNIIVGESGSGKTTLLNILANIEEFDSGQIIKNENERINYNLVDDTNINILTVCDNLNLVTNDNNKIDLYLDELEIEYTKDKKVSTLSKGEQARVSIARSLLSNSNIILLDEPTGNLDVKSTKLIFDFLKTQALNKTIVLVTHDNSFAKEYANKLFELKNKKISLIKEVVNETVNNKKEQSTQEPFKIRKTLILKYAIKKALKKKTLLILNSILIILAVLELFLGISFKNVNYEETSNNLIDSLPNSIYSGSVINKNTQIENLITNNGITKEVYLSPDDTVSNYHGINGILYNELFDNDILEKDINDYVIPSKYEDTDTLKYYPIIISNSFRDFYINEHDILYKVGDILPYSYIMTNNYTKKSTEFEQKFVIVDIIDESFTENYSTDLFPVILSNESYTDFIKHYGFQSFNFVDGLWNKVSELNKSLDTNDKISSLSIPVDSNFIKLSYLSNIKNVDDMAENEEGLCYVGSLPTSDNEIMIGDYYLYYLMNGLYDNIRDEIDVEVTKEKTKDFLLKYEDGFDINLFGSTISNYSESYNINNIKIVGAYSYKKDGILYDLKDDNRVVINDSLMDSLTNDICNNNNNILGNDYCFSKTALKDLHNDILNKNLYFNSKDISMDYFNAMNMDVFANFMLIISLIIFVLSTLTTLVYMNNSYKSMRKDLIVMKLSGINNKNLRRVLFYFTSIVFIPIIIAIPFCFVYLSFIGKRNLSGAVSGGSFSFHYLYSIISLFIMVISYYIISFCYSYIISKKNILEVLKKE